MIDFLFVLLYLSQIIHWQLDSANSSTDCSFPGGVIRSVWTILATCAFTLLICVWQAIHEDVPPPNPKWYEARLIQVATILLSFLLPEWTVYVAGKELWEARRISKEMRDKVPKWSMTHSFFAQMGGFYYRDGEGHGRRIDALEYLRLREENEIANPDISQQDIKDKSKSDALGKTILGLQLIWFVVQAAVRYYSHLSVTLVELDTVCMSVLTIILLIFWHNKPLRPKCPHIFYSHQYLLKGDPDLKHAWRSDPGFLEALMVCFGCRRETQATTERRSVHNSESHPLLRSWMTSMRIKAGDIGGVALLSFCTIWFTFGGLHVAARNFDFATEREKEMWFAASLFLTIVPVAVLVGMAFTYVFRKLGWWEEKRRLLIGGRFLFFSLVLACVSRMILVALMVVSLRSVPCSAFQTIVWTSYIPHIYGGFRNY